MAYSKRYAGGFFDKPNTTTPIDSVFLNAVEAALLKLNGVDPTTDGQVLQWDAANTRFGPALLLNKNIDAAAAIDKSKLNLTGQISDADIAGAAAIAGSKLNLNNILVQPTHFAAGSKITTSAISGGPPATPSSGDIWVATGVDANGTRWAFQYNAGSASAYKWEFIGGADVVSTVDTDETTTSTAFADLATVGPSFVIPRAGDYVVVAGAGMYASAFVTSYGIYVAASSAATVANAGEHDGATGNQLETKQSRPVVSSGLAAGTTVKAQYAVAASATTGHFRDRWLTVRPVRIS